MSRARDYVPSNPAQFNSFMRNLIDYVSQKITAWGHIPQDRFDELEEAYGAFVTAFSYTQGPHTPAQNLARTEVQFGFRERITRRSPTAMTALSLFGT